jgi:hypothetical protein
MAGRKSTFTAETQALILKHFKQTGNLKNSAIRAGMSERSYHRWKAHWENAKSGPLWQFSQEITRARADWVALLAFRHHQGATGGVFEIPVYDRFFNLVCDSNGKPVTVRKLVMPNFKAIWRELTLHEPETYGPQEKATVPELPVRSQSARPLDLREMFISVTRRLKAQGIDFEPAKPALETTATPVDPTTKS